MALNRKYAALPDLDSAPDLYETPDLTDDTSTVQTGTARSGSAASSYKDLEEDDDGSPSISRSRLHPDEARSHFSPAQIDARDVDFSDRITGKRKSYRTSTRRQRLQNGDEEEDSFTDEDDGESLERKMARLRRELEEVKEEVGKRNMQGVGGDNHDVGENFGSAGLRNDVVLLTRMLDKISIQGSPSVPSGSTLIKSLGSTPLTATPNIPTNPEQPPPDSSTIKVTYAPEFHEHHSLAKAADFDTRLTVLEKALGISSVTISAVDPKETPISILPTLESLQRRIFILTDSTPSSLDGISRRVRTLTQDAERLTEARKAAKSSHDELIKAGVDHKTVDNSEDGDSEQVAKVNALYGTLSTIETFSPLLPSLLARLRSLRAIHANAAAASQDLEKIAKRQEEIDVEVRKWRIGLEKVEGAMTQGQKTIDGNMKVVDGWVKELERKISTFEH